ncbi:hypothetical protein NDU88_000803 [Pleurodeles waltl]|uniref:Uncharacterized protein n=1 Tax=Pleurodeles waltl TaxID=8319 RepID=A0AAV7SY18_PLEWA|nr:hypothetical protein NDU88_000803 [Pleurodeles waltl]
MAILYRSITQGAAGPAPPNRLHGHLSAHHQGLVHPYSIKWGAAVLFVTRGSQLTNTQHPHESYIKQASLQHDRARRPRPVTYGAAVVALEIVANEFEALQGATHEIGPGINRALTNCTWC